MTTKDQTIDDSTETEDTVLYCTVHPNVETSLRCNRCGRPMCTRCAIQTPVGYRCKQCVHQQQNVFFSAGHRDYLIAAGLSFIMSAFIGSVLMGIGSLLIILLLSVPAGGLISEVVHRAIGRRRGRYTWIIIGLATATGLLPYLLLVLLPHWLQMTTEWNIPFSEAISFWDLANVLLYAVLAAVTAASRFRYGR